MTGVRVGGSWGLQMGTQHKLLPFLWLPRRPCLFLGHTLARTAHGLRHPECPDLCRDCAVSPKLDCGLEGEQTFVPSTVQLCSSEYLGHRAGTLQAFQGE